MDQLHKIQYTLQKKWPVSHILVWKPVSTIKKLLAILSCFFFFYINRQVELKALKWEACITERSATHCNYSIHTSCIMSCKKHISEDWLKSDWQSGYDCEPVKWQVKNTNRFRGLSEPPKQSCFNFKVKPNGTGTFKLS